VILLKRADGQRPPLLRLDAEHRGAGACDRGEMTQERGLGSQM